MSIVRHCAVATSSTLGLPSEAERTCAVDIADGPNISVRGERACPAPTLAPSSRFFRVVSGHPTHPTGAYRVDAHECALGAALEQKQQHEGDGEGKANNNVARSNASTTAGSCRTELSAARQRVRPHHAHLRKGTLMRSTVY